MMMILWLCWCGNWPPFPNKLFISTDLILLLFLPSLISRLFTEMAEETKTPRPRRIPAQVNKTFTVDAKDMKTITEWFDYLLAVIGVVMKKETLEERKVLGHGDELKGDHWICGGRMRMFNLKTFGWKGITISCSGDKKFGVAPWDTISFSVFERGYNASDNSHFGTMPTIHYDSSKVTLTYDPNLFFPLPK